MEATLGYGTRVTTPKGPGMIVGRTSRTYRVHLDAGGKTNRGRHFGEGREIGVRFVDVQKVTS